MAELTYTKSLSGDLGQDSIDVELFLEGSHVSPAFKRIVEHVVMLEIELKKAKGKLEGLANG